MRRKNFLQHLSTIGLGAVVFPAQGRAEGLPDVNLKTLAADTGDRGYWIEILTKIADPVLRSLSRQELKKDMPVEAVKGREADRAQFTHLEAFGRLLSGMAPWLELGPDGSPEGKLRKKYIDLAVAGIANAVDPASPDYMNFGKPAVSNQALVDTAFLAHALIRAPKQLYGNLSSKTKEQLVTALAKSRDIQPGYNNWLLFTAMVEAFYLQFGHHHDPVRMDYAVRKHNEWYKGDGLYGDGPDFHWDYYNSYVIHPMLLQVLDTMQQKSNASKAMFEEEMKRAQRYAVIQEHLIAPDATFPVIGRSIAYRMGAFQALADIALREKLNGGITPGQVRSAMTATMKKIFASKENFDSKGWLQIGLIAHQPSLGEVYISTGSLYLTSTGFLPLGLPAENPFWSSPAADWTARKVWGGMDMAADHAV